MGSVKVIEAAVDSGDYDSSYTFLWPEKAPSEL